MEIKLTLSETEEFFFNALCNGLSLIGGYGIELTYDPEEYRQARAKLQDPAYEDVLMQILRDGGSLQIIDHEGEGDQNATITLDTVHERVPLTPKRHLLDMHNENDDADTADAILQTVFYKDIIFA